MHKPYKYYGYAPSTVFTLVYGGWSQKKASELLLEPLLNLLRSSPYFEQCRTWEDMIKANKSLEDGDKVGYIRGLKNALINCESMKDVIKFLLEIFQHNIMNT